MEYTFKTANEAFTILYDDLGRKDKDDHQISGFFQSKPRGKLCNETIDLVIKILEPQNCLVWTGIRGLPITYLAKEYLWYLNGSRDPKDAPAKVWDSLKNTEGSDIGLINSNYGSYIFKQKDNKDDSKSVFEATVELFKKDPDTRQGIWQIPIMPHRQDLDTPCTSSAHFILRDNKLYLTMYQRSCDCWFGFANDVTQFIMWQMMLANELNVELGTYKHVFGSFHVYENNFISNPDEFNEWMDKEYIKGKEGLMYFRYFDNRNYKEILKDIKDDFNYIGKTNSKDIDENKLKIDELKYMLKNMKITKFN